MVFVELFAVTFGGVDKKTKAERLAQGFGASGSFTWHRHTKPNRKREGNGRGDDGRDHCLAHYAC